MQRQMLKSKIHRATVTACDRDYVGSITLDPVLMAAADLLANEQVHVWDIDNGARFVTYAIPGEPGEGEVQVNGAAAHLTAPGHLVIVASFGSYADVEAAEHAPTVVHVDRRNAIAAVDTSSGLLMGSPLASAAGFEDPTPTDTMEVSR